jgi:small nuclear ribonucleoprotein (snRNP)-like protein
MTENVAMLHAAMNKRLRIWFTDGTMMEGIMTDYGNIMITFQITKKGRQVDMFIPYTSIQWIALRDYTE